MRNIVKYIAVSVVVLGGVVLGTHICVRKILMSHARKFQPPVAQNIASNKTDFTFVIVGDTGHNTHTFPIILHDIIENRPDFIICIGDFVKYSANKHFAHMIHILDKNVGDIPVFCTPGNHDITMRQHGPLSLEPYINYFGAPYYWFGYGDALFIGMDSSRKSIDDEQWQFYEHTMRNIRPRFKHTVLFTHTPPVNPDTHNQSRRLDDDSVTKMANLISKFKPDAIFAGHIHQYSNQDFHGTPLYTAPASGQRPRGDIPEMGYLVVTVNTGGISVIPKYIMGLNTPTNLKMPLSRRMVVVFGDKYSEILGIFLIILGGILYIATNRSKHR